MSSAQHTADESPQLLTESPLIDDVGDDVLLIAGHYVRQQGNHVVIGKGVPETMAQAEGRLHHRRQVEGVGMVDEAIAAVSLQIGCVSKCPRSVRRS